MIILTCANVDYMRDERDRQYITSYNRLVEYVDENDVVILETVKENELMKSLINYHVIDGGNQSWFTLKGYYECRNLLQLINKLRLNDDEYICKLTGRYMLLNDDVFNIDISGYDALFKLNGDSVQTFFYRIRVGVLKSLINYVIVMKSIVPIERLFKEYIDMKGLNVLYVDELGVEAYQQVEQDRQILIRL